MTTQTTPEEDNYPLLCFSCGGGPTNDETNRRNGHECPKCKEQRRIEKLFCERLSKHFGWNDDYGHFISFAGLEFNNAAVADALYKLVNGDKNA